MSQWLPSMDMYLDKGSTCIRCSGVVMEELNFEGELTPDWLICIKV